MGPVSLLHQRVATMTEQEFWQILHDVPEPTPLFYRLYYQDDGTPVVYTMEDLPGKYIEVDQNTYALASYNVRVVDGKLIPVVPKTYIRKLVPGSGTTCSRSDVSIVVNDDQLNTKWSIKQYETN